MRTAILFAAALCLTGCGGGPKPLPMAATPESSRAALVAALDGWKAGHTAADLAARSPPLTFMDDDFTRGAKLLDYAVEGEGTPRGTGYSYAVTLKLRDRDGARTRDRKVAYTAVTEPNHAVTREERQP